MPRARPWRRLPQLARADGGFHLYTFDGAALPVFDEVTFSLWLRVNGNTTADATICQWVWQKDPEESEYYQLFRLRWFRNDLALAVEIYDPVDAAYVTSRPLGDEVSLVRGELAHLHGHWSKSGGLTIRKNGAVVYQRTSATTVNDIDGATYSDYHAVCGGQGPPIFLDTWINQLQGDIGDLWVGFNQDRPYTDFVTELLHPRDLGATGDVGGGQPQVCFSGGANVWNAAANRGSVSGYLRPYNPEPRPMLEVPSP